MSCKMQLLTSRSGVGLILSVSNKLPGDSHAAARDHAWRSESLERCNFSLTTNVTLREFLLLSDLLIYQL